MQSTTRIKQSRNLFEDCIGTQRALLNPPMRRRRRAEDEVRRSSAAITAVGGGTRIFLLLLFLAAALDPICIVGIGAGAGARVVTGVRRQRLVDREGPPRRRVRGQPPAEGGLSVRTGVYGFLIARDRHLRPRNLGFCFLFFVGYFVVRERGREVGEEEVYLSLRENLESASFDGGMYEIGHEVRDI